MFFLLTFFIIFFTTLHLFLLKKHNIIVNAATIMRPMLTNNTLSSSNIESSVILIFAKLKKNRGTKNNIEHNIRNTIASFSLNRIKTSIYKLPLHNKKCVTRIKGINFPYRKKP